MSKSLYVCYFSLREPLVQTQVLPYLREIRKGGTDVSILTFETNPEANWSRTDVEAERSKLAAEGIDWEFLTYHKRPSVPATIFDVFCGAFYIWRNARRKKFDILHARVHTPALMCAIANHFIFRNKPKLLFDIRGFFPEEYVDAGLWPAGGLLFRTVKSLERWLMRVSDGFVLLTEQARNILFPESTDTGRDRNGRPVEIIPCCVGFDRFQIVHEELRIEMRSKLGISDRLVIAYVGAFGGWYLTEETGRFFGVLRQEKPNAYAMILTQSDPELIRALLEDMGYGVHDYLVTRVSPDDVPKYLSAADAAISFIKPCYSKKASSPTKNAEYLACGLSIIANDGIGDTTDQIETDGTGVVIRDFELKSLSIAIEELDALMKDRKSQSAICRRSAIERFDLSAVGGTRYRRLYERLLTKNLHSQ